MRNKNWYRINYRVKITSCDLMSPGFETLEFIQLHLVANCTRCYRQAKLNPQLVIDLV